PHLNMIIGPNGTGKSTMVAAIILGLGGNPKIVGRGTKISEYVKHDCDYAMINVILQDERENSYIKVTREFDKHDKSSWKLNSRKVKLDEVLQCIEKFNIQVNNLCQFLPQDKVQDFAKLNKQQLLIETQRALCKFDLIEKQEELINSREQHKSLMTTMENYRQKLQDTQDANHIERKVTWTIYEDIRVRLTEIKTDKNKAQVLYDKFRSTMEPMEQEMGAFRRQITVLQQGNSRTFELIRDVESTLNTNFEKVEGFRDHELEKQSLSAEYNNLSSQQNKLQDKVEEISHAKQDDTRKIASLENEMNR
ncbi:hypothetical protein NQ317_006942, partial [Molorchus minor]